MVTHSKPVSVPDRTTPSDARGVNTTRLVSLIVLRQKPGCTKADLFDLNRHRVAGFSQSGGVRAMPNAVRRAGENPRTRQEGLYSR